MPKYIYRRNYTIKINGYFLKKTILFGLGLIFLLIFYTIGYSQFNSTLTQAQKLFDQGTEHYQNENYEQALKIFQEIEKLNVQHSALWHNIGLCHIALNSLGKAKFFFLKSLALDPDFSNSSVQLILLENQFSHSSLFIPQLPWDTLVAFFHYYIGGWGLTIWSLLFLVCAVCFIISSWYLQRFHYLLKFGQWICLFLGFFLLAFMVYHNYILTNYTTGVIIIEEANLYLEPNTESEEISNIYEGYTLTISRPESQKQTEWSYLRLSNGIKGWAKTEIMFTMDYFFSYDMGKN